MMEFSWWSFDKLSRLKFLGLVYGDDEFHCGGSTCSADSGLLISIGSNVDANSLPHKGSHISGSTVFEGNMFEEKESSIEVLLDECMFEIFRRLPGGQKMGASACVPNDCLMLLSSVHNSEIFRSKHTQTGTEVKESTNDIEMIFADENREDECDGYLTRCLEGKKATYLRLAAIAVGTTTCGALRKLSICISNSTCGVTNLDLSSIAHGYPSLKVLSLWNVPSTEDGGLLKIAKELHLLEKFDLCQCPSISNKGVIAIAENCPNFTALTIEIWNESLKAIESICPKLQSITIKDCPLVGDQGGRQSFVISFFCLVKG